MKNLLQDRGINLTPELSDIIIKDIKFNNIGFNKKTTLKEFLDIAERCNKTLKKCVQKGGAYMEDKYVKALEEVLCNLRLIESPNPDDDYIDDSIKIIQNVLEIKKMA
ncbi:MULTISPECIES: hypothetical protein [unclassified Clostridium]|uniref:hypothetical protein n=1 Tax=unclassified Clostridium TaxID=2614128 RepID=UPI0025C5FAF0|nr:MULTISPECIES: hypothetical protein [unclassified Clostridium]